MNFCPKMKKCNITLHFPPFFLYIFGFSFDWRILFCLRMSSIISNKGYGIKLKYPVHLCSMYAYLCTYWSVLLLYTAISLPPAPSIFPVTVHHISLIPYSLSLCILWYCLIPYIDLHRVFKIYYSNFWKFTIIDLPTWKKLLP